MRGKPGGDLRGVGFGEGVTHVVTARVVDGGCQGMMGRGKV